MHVMKGNKDKFIIKIGPMYSYSSKSFTIPLNTLYRYLWVIDFENKVQVLHSTYV